MGPWRVRAKVRDTPGSLAALTAALAGRGVNIVSVQVHVVPDGAVDEFLVEAPLVVTAEDLILATEAGGGLEVHADRADMHDLVDVPTRVLTSAAQATSAGAELPGALRALLGECTIGWRAAEDVDPGADSEEGVNGTTMRLCDPEGGLLTVERPAFPFTPAEFARAHALLELEHRITVRVASQHPVILLANGAELAIRQGVRADAARVTALHPRCDPGSRGGAPAAALERVLTRRQGHALLAEDPAGVVVAMAGLRWDGDRADVAVLVADSWQRQGIGTALLRRLIVVAADAGMRAVCAVTDADNEPMIRAMRKVGARTDQVIPGTVRLTVSPVPRASVRRAAGYPA
jgi:GNAT superfamily N-acetyltransferase